MTFCQLMCDNKRKFLTNDHWHLLLSGQEKLRLYVLRKIGIGCACRDRIFEKAFYLILVYVIVKEVLCFVKKTTTMDVF